MVVDEDIKIIESDNINLFSKVNSFGLNGIHAYPVEIEVNISGGLPHFILVGLPDIAVNESRERVRSAIKSSNIEFPSKKIVVNLAPADTKKAGPNYDLPIAIGILAGINIINSENLNGLFLTGELGLSGKVRGINGVLSYILLARKQNAKGIIIPKANLNEASLIEDINIYPIESLNEAIHIINDLNNIKPFVKTKTSKINSINDDFKLDLNDVKGQILAKRALEIAASGGHHLLMIGPPGAGKSMLSERLPSILLSPDYEEKIEITQIYSAAGKLSKEKNIITERPFRSPHHSISAAGLIGGGTIPQPGEISLSHKGVLFLDEFTEFQKSVLNSLRQALEKKEITISRSRKSLTFPCDFTLIAACNPCPCGYYGDSIKKCTCNKLQIKNYLSKISGPLIDRIDLQVEIKRLSENELMNSKPSESSKSVKERVLKAKELQKERFKSLNITSNSELNPKQINKFCTLNKDASLVIKDAIKTFNLTGRSYDRVLKVGRTIADLEEDNTIQDKHILEALQFRFNSLFS